MSLEAIQERIDSLTKWLEENGDGCAEKQRHLDAGTCERAYWHYGYLMALRDVIAYLDGSWDVLH